MRTPFVHPSVMMRKDLIVKYNLYYDSNYFTEDYELWSRAIKYFPIANINQILLLYRAGKEDALTNSINDEKIQNSHLKIMSNQFKEYLGCEMSYDELQLLQGRKWISENFNNFKALDEKLDKTIEKVINLNKEKHFYNQSTLVEVIYQERKGIVKKGSLFKRIIMKIVLPFYSFGMRKVDKRIAFNEKNLMKDLNMRFKELDNRIKKLEQKKNE